MEESNTSTRSDMLLVKVPPRKITPGMREALTALSASLICPICNEILREPSTLASCAHTFCQDCIKNHVSDSWLCPYPGCGISVAIRGDKSYLRTNPSLLSVVTALENINSALTSARDDWWKASSVSFSTNDSTHCQNDHSLQTAVSIHHAEPSDKNATLDDEEEEIVDLQANNNVLEFKTPSHWKNICLQPISSLKKRFFSNTAASEGRPSNESSSVMQKRTKFLNRDELMQPNTIGSTSSSDSPTTIVYDKLEEDNTSMDTPFPGDFTHPFSPSITQGDIATSYHPPVDESMATFDLNDKPASNGGADEGINKVPSELHDKDGSKDDCSHEDEPNEVATLSSSDNICDNSAYSAHRTPANNAPCMTTETITVDPAPKAVSMDPFEEQLKKIERLKKAIAIAKNGKGISSEKLAALEKNLEEAESVYADMVLEAC